ncbi:MAG: endo-1,4-beta-xylanase [Planctomycetes bacterium]|nr:endo-1,4-beta-xylanase [Planctomycetota bacterium]
MIGRYLPFATRRLILMTVWTMIFLAWIAPPQPTIAQDSLWQQASERIEKHRKRETNVQIVDRDGHPVAGAKLHFEQTRHAFLFGCNIFNWGRTGDDELESAYRQRYADVFNYATLPFYWASYERQQGNPNHERTRQIAQWCREQGIVCKGHPLAWNYSDPPWLPSQTQTAFELQLHRINDCVSRFEGLIDIWDVVNEATHFDRDEFKRRAPRMTTMWSEIGQIEFTRRCMQAARAANEDAVLLINDYRVDTAYERVIEQLVDEDGRRLYDVIGIQSHQHGGVWPNAKIWEVCERFARFGVPLHFTETTIVSGPRPRGGDPWNSTETGEKEQAKEVERFYTMLVSHPAVEAITWWDFSDLHAWQDAPAGFLRKDMSPKPAYEKLRELI